jgi:hypothetical protein
MSLTIREQIYAKLEEVLSTALMGVRVERNRDSAVQVFPTVVVIDGGQIRQEPESTGFNEYVMTPTIEGWVDGETQADLGPALNELYGQTVKALMADRKLGGLAIDMAEGPLEVDVSRRENQGPVAGFALDIEVRFWTAEDDPFELGPSA